MNLLTMMSSSAGRNKASAFPYMLMNCVDLEFASLVWSQRKLEEDFLFGCVRHFCTHFSFFENLPCHCSINAALLRSTGRKTCFQSFTALPSTGTLNSVWQTEGGYSTLYFASTVLSLVVLLKWKHMMNVRKNTSCLADILSFESCVKISGPDRARKLSLNKGKKSLCICQLITLFWDVSLKTLNKNIVLVSLFKQIEYRVRWIQLCPADGWLRSLDILPMTQLLGIVSFLQRFQVCPSYIVYGALLLTFTKGRLFLLFGFCHAVMVKFPWLNVTWQS